MTNNNIFTKRKRPFGATFRSLNDITNSSTTHNGETNDSAATAKSKIAIHHIPSLPNDEEAAAILRRIHSEFHTIIERRGWNVTSITEMCCCGDGIDCLKKGGRKTRVMPNNVLGYNRTHSSRGQRANSVHDIHLRLRHPKSHVIVDYESIAATMCHELAHCVRGPHDAKFYRAMEEIEEQYSVYLARGVVVDKDGFPIGSSEAHTLGSIGGDAGKKSGSDKWKGLGAAESRQKKNQSGGFTLGGKSTSIPKDPREAALIAAERRLLDSQYCLPCNEIIEILGDDSSEEESDDEVEVIEAVSNMGEMAVINADRRGPDEQKQKPDIEKNRMDTIPKAKVDSTSVDVIDLTLDDSFTVPLPPLSISNPTSKSRRNNNPNRTAQSVMNQQSTWWSCSRCTLSNPPLILVCAACCLELPCSTTVLDQAKDLKKEDDIAYIKEREVEQSKETFGGFNIYGEKKNSSSTMKHLT